MTHRLRRKVHYNVVVVNNISLFELRKINIRLRILLVYYYDNVLFALRLSLLLVINVIDIVKIAVKHFLFRLYLRILRNESYLRYLFNTFF